MWYMKSTCAGTAGKSPKAAHFPAQQQAKQFKHACWLKLGRTASPLRASGAGYLTQLQRSKQLPMLTTYAKASAQTGFTSSSCVATDHMNQPM
jgi:hypothetical protein